MSGLLPDIGDLRLLADPDSASQLLADAGIGERLVPCWLRLDDRHALVGFRRNGTAAAGPLHAYAVTGPASQTRSLAQRLQARHGSDKVLLAAGGQTLVLRFPVDRRMGDLEAALDPSWLVRHAHLVTATDRVRSEWCMVRPASWRPEERATYRVRWGFRDGDGPLDHVARLETEPERGATALAAAVAIGRSAPGLVAQPIGGDGDLVIEELVQGSPSDLDRDAVAVGHAVARLHHVWSTLPERTVGWFVEQAALDVDLLARAGLTGPRRDPTKVLDRILGPALEGLGAPSGQRPDVPVTSHGRLRPHHLRVDGDHVRLLDLTQAARQPAEADLAALVVRCGPAAVDGILTIYEAERRPVDLRRLVAHTRLAHLGRACDAVLSLEDGWPGIAAHHLDNAIGGDDDVLTSGTPPPGRSTGPAAASGDPQPASER